MKLTFKYTKEKDVWCVMNYGAGSFNSKEPTEVYKKMVLEFGENINETNTSSFIDSYLKERSISIQKYVDEYQSDWDSISNAYYKKAEEVFGVSLQDDIDVYLSVNDWSPYSLKENWFFVTLPAFSMRRTVMHELWHFYTWYRFGREWEEKLGRQRYNDIKESLTVLLNVECKDLLAGAEDKGYAQHADLREKILSLWNKEKDIGLVWNELSNIA